MKDYFDLIELFLSSIESYEISLPHSFSAEK